MFSVVIDPHWRHLRAAVSVQRAQIGERLFLQQIRVFFWYLLSHCRLPCVLFLGCSKTLSFLAALHRRRSDSRRKIADSPTPRQRHELRSWTPFAIAREYHSAIATFRFRFRSSQAAPGRAGRLRRPHPFPGARFCAPIFATLLAALHRNAWQNSRCQSARETTLAARAGSHW